MKAIILAGGPSSRLRPITNNLPKCLLKFGKKAIVDYQVETLKNNEITDIVVVIGFQAKKLSSYLVKHHPDANFIFIENKRFTETYPAYGLWLAKDYLDEAVVFLVSDLLCDPEIIERVIKCRKPTATAVQQNPWDEEEANVILGKDKVVLEIGKQIGQELSDGEFLGATKLGKTFNKKFKKSLNDFVKNQELKKFVTDAMNLTIQRGAKMHAVDVSDLKAIEIDTIEDYKKAKKIFKKIKAGNLNEYSQQIKNFDQATI